MEKPVYTVSELNAATQKLLEGHFGTIRVEGEISNLSRPTSGHAYFSLKDARSQIRCAFFRLAARSLNIELKNGLLVQIEAKVSLYPDRGDYQLIVLNVALAGEGLLRQAFDALVRKLTEEGLFQEKWKKSLPRFPKQIGVITSSTGAALRDILHVLNRRFPGIQVIIYPTKVQGTEAAAEIVRAIEWANRQNVCDALIVARGGGSLEDLWPFNEEIVARAIFASALPIVTGVGHETDFTIADFVSDVRAPTPSAAAEIISPLQTEIMQQLQNYENRLINEIIKLLQFRFQKVDHLLKRLRHPRLEIELQLNRLKGFTTKLHLIFDKMIKLKRSQFVSSLRALEMVSPLATLGRGYAIVSRLETGKILRSVKECHKADKLNIRLSDGEIACQAVEEVEEKASEAV